VQCFRYDLICYFIVHNFSLMLVLPMAMGCVLYVGGFGDVRVLTAGGDDVTFVGINGGTFVPVQVLRVFATNTTATSIVAMW